ncbi:MAG: serine/threonine protein kinase [Planctomycetia bacterium]|nr:serine/threonine protein kinase [Planctomycetia bacterium]
MVKSVAEFVESIRQHRLLEPEQQDELARTLQAKFPDPRALAKQLIQQNWLTPYQVNHVFQGKADGLVLGSYVIQEKLGEGGMGIVYKARNWKIGRTVALKVIRREHVANNDAIRRFRREIEAVNQLNHPNIVAALDADQIGDVHYFVMEYVDGFNLSNLLKEKGPPPVPLACDYIRQVASGLQQAGERGMVHRDIKPANLLVQRPSGQSSTGKPDSSWGSVIKILDMGVARIQQGDDRDSISALTKDGKVVGTPDYMAPEQAVNSAKADIRADIYSLGCTFYHVLTGQVPYPGGTPMEKLLKHRIDQPKPIEQLRPEVPHAVIAVVRKAMAKKAEDRFQTPAEVAQALEQLFPRGQTTMVPQAIPLQGQAAIPVAGVPQAVPVQGIVGEVPMAQPVYDVAPAAPFAWGTASPAAGLMSGSRLQRALQDKRSWVLIAGALITLLLGLIFLVVAVMTSGPRRSGRAPPPDALTALMQELLDRPTRTPAQREALRDDLVRFRARHLGTSQAHTLARYLMKLPSPLDELRREDIPAARKPAALPEEVVAVLGEHRQRHWGAARSVAFSNNGELIASGGDDRLVRVFDGRTMQERAALPGHGASVRWLAFTPDSKVLLSLATDGSLRFWDLPPGKPPQARPESVALGQEVAVAAFAPDGWTLACRADAKTIRVLDLRGPLPGGKPKIRALLASPEPFGQALAFSPNGKSLAAAGANPVISLWDLSPAQPRVRTTLRGPAAEVLALAFSRDGNRLASGGLDRTIRVWGNINAANPVEQRQFQGHEGEVLALAFVDKDQYLLSAGADQTTRYWHLPGGREAQRLIAQPTHWINAVAVHAGGNRVATAGQDTTVRLWEPATDGRFIEKFPLIGPPGMAESVAFSATGQLLAYSHDAHPFIDLWDISRNQFGRIEGDNGWGYWLAFAPEGMTLASAGCFADNAELWDLEALSRRGPDLLPHPQRVQALAISPDGKWLATGCADRIIRLYSLTGARPKEVRKLIGHRQGVAALAFAPDGQTLASAGEDQTVRFWQVQTGRELHQLTEQRVAVLAYAPDGKTLACGGRGADGRPEIRLWNVAGDEPPRDRRVNFQGEHRQAVTALVFSPDGEALISSGQDGQLFVHGPTSGQSLRSWRFPGAIRHLSLAVDGRHLATANSNGTVYILRLRTPGARL